MALVLCSECSKEISDKAEKCVNCGAPVTKMLCAKCGLEIDKEAVICPGCGVATPNFHKQMQPQPQIRDPYEPQQKQVYQQAPAQPNITIVNRNTATAQVGRVRRRRSFLFDLFMIFITGGLWIIWMIFRPKYY